MPLSELKERYDGKAKEIRNLETTIAELEEAGETVSAGFRFDLMRAHAELEELRLWGHREHTRQMQEARERTAERDMLERVRAEWERIDAMPVLSPEEIRRKRKELGARQQDLAAFAGVHRDTVGSVERGDACDPQTLKLISAGLEEMRRAQKSEVL